MPSTRVDGRLTPGKATQAQAAVATIEDLLGPMMDAYRALPEAARREVLAHSPVLASVVRLSERVR